MLSETETKVLKTPMSATVASFTLATLANMFMDQILKCQQKHFHCYLNHNLLTF